jgi:thiamine-monophosphate kinase
MPGEFDYIRWLRTQTPADPRVLVGPGDDAAVLARPAGPVLVTVDLLMDGTDFVLSECGPRAAGRKAMAVNLSDIAAMAGVPTAAVVSVALPRPEETPPPNPLPPRGRGLGGGVLPSFPSPRGGGGRGAGSLPHDLYLGLRDVADAFGVAVVGGDTNSWAGRLVISVTVLGEATARGPVLRSGARPGDWVMVTGPLGGSIRGHHLTFTPRVREALRLHEAAELHAMADISDGLAADLNHILDESRCGAVLAAEAIPIAPAAVELSRETGRTPLDHALGDGEDFELVFTVSPADGERLVRGQPVPGVTLTKVGECVAAGLWLEQAGTRRPLEPTGWVHRV